MKILTILLILLQINTFSYGNYSSANSNNRYSGGNVPVEQTYRGIGYSTNYANGQFNSGVYKSSMTTLEYQNRVFTGTYNPAVSGSGGSRPGQPRKVRGYDENGNPVGDDNGNEDDFWEEGYDYYWDGEHWWRKDRKNNGFWSWRIYTNTGWDWHWSILEQGWKGHPNPNTTPKAYPTPIGDAIIPLLSLLLLYIGYDIFKKESIKKHK